MKYLNVLTKQQFHNGSETVTLWHKIGIIKITKNGGMFLQLFQQPNTDFYVFEDKEDLKELPEIQLEQKG